MILASAVALAVWSLLAVELGRVDEIARTDWLGLAARPEHHFVAVRPWC